jgi:hypothetical protein
MKMQARILEGKKKEARKVCTKDYTIADKVKGDSDGRT